MIRLIEDIKKWYMDNLGKLVLLFFVVVFFTTSVAYIPYLNIIIRSSIGILISLVTLYLLFPPPTKVLVFISGATLSLSYIFVMLKINFIVDLLGSLLFLLLLLTLINYIRDINDKKKK